MRTEKPTHSILALAAAVLLGLASGGVYAKASASATSTQQCYTWQYCSFVVGGYCKDADHPGGCLGYPPDGSLCENGC